MGAMGELQDDRAGRTGQTEIDPHAVMGRYFPVSQGEAPDGSQWRGVIIDRQGVGSVAVGELTRINTAEGDAVQVAVTVLPESQDSEPNTISFTISNLTGELWQHGPNVTAAEMFKHIATAMDFVKQGLDALGRDPAEADRLLQQRISSDRMQELVDRATTWEQKKLLDQRQEHKEA